MHAPFRKTKATKQEMAFDEGTGRKSPVCPIKVRPIVPSMSVPCSQAERLLRVVELVDDYVKLKLEFDRKLKEVCEFCFFLIK